LLKEFESATSMNAQRIRMWKSLIADKIEWLG
jgi:hypothetical protein